MDVIRMCVGVDFPRYSGDDIILWCHTGQFEVCRGGGCGKLSLAIIMIRF